MNITTIRTIVIKELKGLLHNGATYVIIVVFLLLWQFLFFRSAFLVGESSLRGMFDLFPWIAIVFIPAITMSLINRETEEGTLEIVLTQPVRESELVIAKWFSTILFVSAVLLFTLPIALVFSRSGTFDWGAYAGQLVGAIFFSSALVAVGVASSTYIKNAIATLLVAAALSFFFLVIGTEFISAVLPQALVPVFERLSFLSHFQLISRGVLDTRDVWFFISITAFVLSLSYLSLLKRKHGNVKRRYASFQAGVILFAGCIVLTNLLGDRIPGRLDLTRNKSYTLSPGTKKVMSELPDIVTLTLYASEKLPPQYAPILRETKDIVKDLKQVAGDKLTVSYKNPSDPSVASEANSRGISEVQFNVIGAQELQVKTGFLGIAIDYGGKEQIIPLIKDVSDLEYQLVSSINMLTITEKRAVSVLSAHGEKNTFSDLSLIQEELSKQFTLSTEEQIATDAALLVVAGPGSAYDESLIGSIHSFIGKGGSALFLVDMAVLSPQQPTATASQNNLNTILEKYGVSADANIAYDLKAHEIVSLTGASGVNYLTPYPFWLIGLPASNSPLTSRIQGVLMPWPSPLTLKSEKANEANYTIDSILTTTDYAGKESNATSIEPGKVAFDESGLSALTLAAALTPKEGTTGGRIVVVGDSDFATSQFVESKYDNRSFILQTIGWLTQADYISSISSRKPVAGKLSPANLTDALLLRYLGFTLSFLVPVAFGSWILLKRRNLRFQTYHHERSKS